MYVFRNLFWLKNDRNALYGLKQIWMFIGEFWTLLSHSSYKEQSGGTYHRNWSGKGAVVELCPEEIDDEWGQRGKQSAQGKTQEESVNKLLKRFTSAAQLQSNEYDLIFSYFESHYLHQIDAESVRVIRSRFYLILVGLWVLHSLEAYGHDDQRRWWQVFNYWDQVTLLCNSLHLRPANRLIAQL